MPKYRDVFRQMIKENEATFVRFMEAHQKYEKDRRAWQTEFNDAGEEVMKLVRHYEHILCGKTERGDNAVFSSKLADKFKAEVKAFFPLIDFVGAEYD